MTAQEVTRLRKAGDLVGARRLAMQLLAETPEDLWVRRSMSWVVYDELKAVVERAKVARGPQRELIAMAARCVDEYLALGLPRPDLSCGRIADRLVALPGGGALLCQMVLASGFESFPLEDLRPQQGADGKTYDAVVERVARELGKAAVASGEQAVLAAALAFIERVLADAAPQQPEWLHYRKALLLAALGRRDEARAALLPFLRRKREEYWAWSALGVVEEERPDGALAALAMAHLQCRRPDFIINVEQDLARHAAAVGLHRLARWAADRAIRTRQERRWRVPESLEQFTRASWYTEGTLSDAEAATALRDLAPKAEELLFLDARDLPASYVESYATPSGAVRHSIALRDGDVDHVISLPEPSVQDEDLCEPGRPLWASALTDEDLVTVRSIRARADGAPFDVVPCVVGVVDHVNGAKGVTSVYLPGDEVALLRHDRFIGADDLRAGQGLRLWATSYERDGVRRWTVHRYEDAQVEPSPSIRTWTGSVKPHPSGFGFLDDVFVPPHVCKACPEGTVVTLLAVRTMNEKKHRMGWKAVARVDAVATPRHDL